jgi:hypothetical protein
MYTSHPVLYAKRARAEFPTVTSPNLLYGSGRHQLTPVLDDIWVRKAECVEVAVEGLLDDVPYHGGYYRISTAPVRRTTRQRT